VKKELNAISILEQQKVFIVFSLLVSFLWLWVALHSFNNYRAIELVNQDSPNYSSLVNTIDPLYSEALFFAGLGYAENNGGISKDEGLDRSIERVYSDVAWYRPASPVAWMELAQWSAQNGFVENAIVYAESAYLLLDNKPDLGWELFDLFIYLGNRQRALSVARLYATNITSSIDEVILKMRNEQFSNNEIVNTLLGYGSKELVTDFPYENANNLMLKLIQLEEVSMAKDAWAYMAAKNVSLSSRVTESFLKILKKNNDFLTMQKVLQHLQQWQGYNTILPLVADNLNNSSGSNCWRIIDSKQPFYWSLDPTEKISVNASLKLDFVEGSNLNLYHIYCEYLVQPKADTIVVSGYWKGERVTSDQGIFVTIHDDDNKIIGTLAKKTGNWEWQRFDIIVPVSPNISLNKLVIRRTPSKNLDNKLSGSVWFSEFNIN